MNNGKSIAMSKNSVSQEDFQAALSMVRVLLDRLENKVSEPKIDVETEVDNPKSKGDLSQREEEFLKALPKKFDRAEYLLVGAYLEIPDGSAKRYIKRFLDKGLITRKRTNVYENNTIMNSIPSTNYIGNAAIYTFQEPKTDIKDETKTMIGQMNRINKFLKGKKINVVASCGGFRTKKGTSDLERLREIISYVERRKNLDYLIVASDDRLTTDRAMLSRFKKRLAKSGIEVLAVGGQKVKKLNGNTQSLFDFDDTTERAKRA